MKRLNSSGTKAGKISPPMPPLWVVVDGSVSADKLREIQADLIKNRSGYLKLAKLEKASAIHIQP
jgi:hypothetical protein